MVQIENRLNIKNIYNQKNKKNTDLLRLYNNI